MQEDFVLSEVVAQKGEEVEVEREPLERGVLRVKNRIWRAGERMDVETVVERVT